MWGSLGLIGMGLIVVMVFFLLGVHFRRTVPNIRKNAVSQTLTAPVALAVGAAPVAVGSPSEPQAINSNVYSAHMGYKDDLDTRMRTACYGHGPNESVTGL
jgi:hypothetical protein